MFLDTTYAVLIMPGPWDMNRLELYTQEETGELKVKEEPLGRNQSFPVRLEDRISPDALPLLSIFIKDEDKVKSCCSVRSTIEIV